MDNSANAIVYFKGDIIRNTSEGVRFTYEEPAYFSIPYTMSFAELENELCRCVNVDTPKKIEKIMYRCPISVVGGFIRYQPTPINDDSSIQQMFMIHQRHQPNIPIIELYVNFKENALTLCHQPDNEGDHNSLMTGQNYEESRPITFQEQEVECETNNNEGGGGYFEGEYKSNNDDVDDDADDEDVSNRMTSQNWYDGQPFMRASNLEVMQTPDFPEYANIGVPSLNGELYVGMHFNNREAVIQAIKSYNISKAVNYKVYAPEPTTFYCKCVRYGIDCGWLLQASFIKNKQFWEITSYKGPHTCTRTRISLDHAKLDSNMIAQYIEPMVRFDPTFKVKSIIVEIQSRYRHTTTYWEAWAAKQKAIEKVFGSWEGSYEALPQWCLAMCATDRGAIAFLDSVKAYRGNDLVPNVRLLRRVFWSFGPCIRAFRHCKPLIQVDGTHLYGKYKGALLVAVAQDGNKNMLPVAFAIVEGDTADAWYFFLDNLRRHVLTQDGICIVSDYNQSIKAAMTQSNGQWEPPKAFHKYCVRHIAANFLQRFKAHDLHKLVVSIGNSRTKCEFNYHYERLRERGKVYTDWIDQIPREKWVLAFDGGHRWGHMTTNLVECINSVLKGVRNLPITSLVRATYFRLAELFAQKGKEAHAQKNAGHVFSEAMATQLRANEQASRNIRVSQFDRRNESFCVQELPNKKEYKVDLRQRYCDCGNFFIDRYPCPHVIACCSSQNYDWHVYVDDIYRKTEICKVYKKEFGVIGPKSTWPQYVGPKLCPNPALERTMKGRPKSNCFLNGMDMWEMREPRHCSFCRGKGNDRNRCLYAPGPSS